MSDLERYAPLRRILAVARSVEKARVVNVDQLAIKHGVSSRTMRRYLEALESVGWPLPRWRFHEDLYRDRKASSLSVGGGDQ